MSHPTPNHANRLARESSPYLLQHQHNPVDWYPWGEEAFRAAREQNKPIFLSVGYSTCYWCHVMERQCFEDASIAGEMNQRFINIKVDREERPDVDSLYMTALQVLTRHGGWPMSVFLTPDLRPFYAGTYFPPEDAGNRPGFPRLLAGLDDAWQHRKDEIEKTSDQLLAVLHQLASPRRPETDLTFDPAKLDEFIERSISDYEPRHGGFGRAPKFPRQTLLRLLLTYLDTPSPSNPDLANRIRQMLTHTLDAMDRGGIHDHLGGGFHRYSTDAEWLIPHFEIMLYDQAMLAEVYAVASRILARPHYARVARDVCDFVLREMTSEDGAFYTAMDAEVDTREGLSYLWTDAEIRRLLGPEDAALFNCVYGVDQGPNFSDPHHPTEDGAPDTNILFLDRPIEQAAFDHGLTAEALEARLVIMRSTLKAARDQRKQPLLDTKILTGWNALMSLALATCAAELKEPSYVHAAQKNCQFLLKHHRTQDAGLSRALRPRHPAFIDDYASLALACLAAGGPDLSQAAHDLLDQLLRRFGSSQCAPCGAGGSCGCATTGTGGGGLFFTDESADDLIVRQKIATDSPLPSGNAQALQLLLATGQSARAKALLTDFAQLLDDNAEGMSSLTQGLLLYVRAHGTVTVAARPTDTNIPPTPEALAKRVVEVEARLISDTEFQVRLTIQPGYHIHAAQVNQPGLIPTRLSLDEAEVTYPLPETATLAFSPEPLDIYQGQIIFTARLPASRQKILRGTLTYQPCDDTSCLPPVTRQLEIHP